MNFLESVLQIPSPTEKTGDYLKKLLIPGLGQKMYKMNMGHLDVPGRKEAIKVNWGQSKDTGANLK